MGLGKGARGRRKGVWEVGKAGHTRSGVVWVNNNTTQTTNHQPNWGRTPGVGEGQWAAGYQPSLGAGLAGKAVCPPPPGSIRSGWGPTGNCPPQGRAGWGLFPSFCITGLTGVGAGNVPPWGNQTLGSWWGLPVWGQGLGLAGKYHPWVGQALNSFGLALGNAGTGEGMPGLGWGSQCLVTGLVAWELGNRPTNHHAHMGVIGLAHHHHLPGVFLGLTPWGLAGWAFSLKVWVVGHNNVRLGLGLLGVTHR